MTARVLVVDDVEANVRLLESRLTADYFQVRTPELILKRPDQAPYCAKRDGRNRVVADAA